MEEESECNQVWQHRGGVPSISTSDPYGLRNSKIESRCVKTHIGEMGVVIELFPKWLR